MTRHADIITAFEELCRRNHDLPALLARAQHDRVPRMSEVDHLVDFGCLALAVAEHHGGFGLEAIDVATMAMISGRYLVPLHFVHAILLAGPTLAASNDDALFENLVDGRIEVGTTFGPSIGDSAAHAQGSAEDHRRYGWAPADANLVITAQPESLAGHRLDGDRGFVAAHALDPGQGFGFCVLDFGDGTEAVTMPDTTQATRTWQLWQLGMAGLALGCARRVLEQSVAYARTRRQFGKPIASFQAVAHQLADMHVDMTASESMLARTATSVQAGSADAARELASLVHWLPARARDVCERGIQVHGGIGFTWELGLHLYYRRVLTVQSLLGGERGTARQVAAAVAE